MKETSIVDETDLGIVNALQVNPRADWAQIGHVLGLSAATLTRRWQALSQRRLAWITPAPGHRYLSASCSAFIHLSSVPGEHESLVRSLCAEPAFATVSLVSGAHDLFIDCFASNHGELMDIVTGVLATLPGVTHREVVFVTELYRQASEWRSGSLEPGQARLLAGGPRQAPPGYVPDGLDAALLRGLSRDGRASWAELGAACGVSPQTAKRRVERFLAAGYMTLRCDTAAAVEPGQREVSLVVNVPATQVEAVGRYFAGLPACRVSAQVLGAQNLLLTFWLRDYAELHAHERELFARAPGSTVVARQATVRTYKRLGHLLDASGRSVGTVPLPLWTQD